MLAQTSLDSIEERALRQPDSTAIGQAEIGTFAEVPVEAADRRAFGARALHLAMLAAVVFFGASVRWFAIARSDFPVNDGGMFYQAIVQIKDAHFHLPMVLHYNGLNIPFAYPPLGFYVAALISSATGAGAIQLLRFLPFVFSVGTIIAFMLFASAFEKNRPTVIVASLAFALVPRSHNWEMMGGGLTRGLGFLFAIIALWQTYCLFTRRSRLNLVLASVFGALTCLSHIEMAWFLVFSSALFCVVFGRSMRGVRDAVILSLGVLALTSPWWLIVVSRDGLAPFMNAGHSGADALTNILGLGLIFNWGDEPWFPLFGALAALGLILSLRRGQTFLPLWVLVTLVLDTRKFQTDAMVPLSILVGGAVVQFLIPLMTASRNGWVDWKADDRDSAVVSQRILTWLSPVVVAMMLGYGWMSSIAADAGSYTSLTTPERDAMNWVHASTPTDAHFAIVTGDSWARDRSSEWFPVLSGRVSVATVQGYEWAPDNGFNKQMANYEALQKCSTETATCINDWTTATGMSFDYIYLATREAQQSLIDYHAPCCSGLIDSLEHDPSYALVFQNDGAAIFKHVTASGD